MEIPIDDNASWGWRKLMELRDQARPHIRHCLGKGESTSMWHDYWCDIGPIDEIVTRRQIFSAGFYNNATVASMLEMSNGKNMVKFSINRVWKDLSEQYNKVAWYKVDRISKWYPNKSMRCSLCCDEMDSHSHLFFKCKYAVKIWNEAKGKCQMQSSSNDWKRNSRLFQCMKKDWKDVWSIIEETVKMKMTRLKVEKQLKSLLLIASGV
ncbi:hypothetical protein Tco_1286706 [Tanacetum coccineum]